MGAIEAGGTNNGVHVKVPPIDEINTCLGNLVNFTGDDGDVGLQQRLEVAFSWGESGFSQIRAAFSRCESNLPSTANVKLRNQLAT